MFRILRPLAMATASAALLTGAAAAAHASTTFTLPVGAEVCITKTAYSVRADGHSSPYVARFTVRRNGVELWQVTGTDFAAQYSGFGTYEFCGKNKLGNPGPISVSLSLS